MFRFQVLDLQDNELEDLCTHMGHSIGVHREYYRLPTDVREVAKVGKLLCLLESGGGPSSLSGKRLKEIEQLSDIEEGIPVPYVSLHNDHMYHA